MKGLKKFFLSWFCIPVFGLLIVSLMLEGIGAWGIAITIIIGGAVAYKLLYKKLGIIVMSIGGIIIACQLLGIGGSALIGLFKALGFIGSIVVVGVTCYIIHVISHR